MKFFIKNTNVISEFAFAHKIPSSKLEIKAPFVLFERTDQRFLHRIVAPDTYYGSDTGRFDDFMIEEDQESKLENKNVNKVEF